MITAGLNYNHLRYFWAVAHDGNLTRTADRLGISQSALSVQIRKLEERLGHDLFERRGRQLLLTEAGRVALDHADAIFQAGEELLSTLRNRSPGRRQVLRVGALATLSRNFQISFLRPVVGRADVELVLRSGTLAELLQGLEAHRLDVVLVNAPVQRDSATPWVLHRIADQPISLVGPPDRTFPPADLAGLISGHPVILPTAESSIRIGFDALVERLGVSCQVAAEVDDMAMIRLLVREGAGLAVVPPIVVRDELDSGLLVEIRQLPQLTESFYALTLSRRFPNPLVRDLIVGYEHAAP